MDIGQGAYWWDYGQLKLYFANSIRVTEVRRNIYIYREREESRSVCVPAPHPTQIDHPPKPITPLPPSPLQQNDAEAALYRTFLGVPSSRRAAAALAPSVAVDDASVLSAARVGAGRVQGSVLTNVVAAEAEVEGAVLVNVTARKIQAAQGTVVYNVVDDSEVCCVGRMGFGRWLAGSPIPTEPVPNLEKKTINNTH